MEHAGGRNRAEGDVTAEERETIERWMRTYGNANCWTGQLGTGAKYIHKLLQVIDEYERRLSKISVEQVSGSLGDRIRSSVDT